MFNINNIIAMMNTFIIMLTIALLFLLVKINYTIYESEQKQYDHLKFYHPPVERRVNRIYYENEEGDMLFHDQPLNTYAE